MRKINIDELEEMLRVNRHKGVVLVSHSIADADFMSSAIALSSYLDHPRMTVPDKISSSIEGILKKEGIKYSTSTSLGDYDVAIMLDVNDFDGCGNLGAELKRADKPIIIIDHHAPKDIQKDSVYAFDGEGYTSASSIIYHILKDLGATISQEEAKLLLIGIVSDSADLRNSTPQTFDDVSELMRTARTDYPTIQNIISYDLTSRERYRIIDSISKSGKMMINGLLLVYGRSEVPAHITSYMSIKVGADIALFYSMYKDEISFSVRIRHPADKKYGIHAGILMRDVSGIIGGIGGGHPCAAGAYGKYKDKQQQFIDEFIKRVTEAANKHASGS